MSTPKSFAPNEWIFCFLAFRRMIFVFVLLGSRFGMAQLNANTTTEMHNSSLSGSDGTNEGTDGVDLLTVLEASHLPVSSSHSTGEVTVTPGITIYRNTQNSTFNGTEGNENQTPSYASGTSDDALETTRSNDTTESATDPAAESTNLDRTTLSSTLPNSTSSSPNNISSEAQVFSSGSPRSEIADDDGSSPVTSPLSTSPQVTEDATTAVFPTSTVSSANSLFSGSDELTTGSGISDSTDSAATVSVSPPDFNDTYLVHAMILIVNRTCPQGMLGNSNRLLQEVTSVVNGNLGGKHSKFGGFAVDVTEKAEEKSVPRCLTYYRVNVDVRGDDRDYLLQRIKEMTNLSLEMGSEQMGFRFVDDDMTGGDGAAVPANSTADIDIHHKSRSLLSEEELGIFIAVGTCFGFLLLCALVVCCIKCVCRRNDDSKISMSGYDVADLPHVNLRLEDYSLTKIPRPNTTQYTEYFAHESRPANPMNGSTVPHARVPSMVQPFDTSVVPLEAAANSYEPLRFSGTEVIPENETSSHMSTFGRNRGTRSPSNRPTSSTHADNNNAPSSYFWASNTSREKLANSHSQPTYYFTGIPNDSFSVSVH